MNKTIPATKDPVCGMTVDEKTSLHAERDGKTYYFCGEQCLKKFNARPASAASKPTGKTGGCCS